MMDQAQEQHCPVDERRRPGVPRRRVPRRRVAAVVVLALAVLLPALAALLPASPASAVFPGLNGRIAFASFRDGNSEIYTINPDGSGLTRLTDNPATDSSPRWNLLGTKIAFTSDRDGAPEVYVMSPDGSAVTRITDGGGGGPSWSPDGSRIAMARGTEGSTELHVVNLATGQVTRLTTDSCNRFPSPGVVDESCEYTRIGNHRPSWSPDGRLIAFLKLRTPARPQASTS